LTAAGPDLVAFDLCLGALRIWPSNQVERRRTPHRPSRHRGRSLRYNARPLPHFASRMSLSRGASDERRKVDEIPPWDRFEIESKASSSCRRGCRPRSRWGRRAVGKTIERAVGGVASQRSTSSLRNSAEVPTSTPYGSS